MQAHRLRWVNASGGVQPGGVISDPRGGGWRRWAARCLAPAAARRALSGARCSSDAAPGPQGLRVRTLGRPLGGRREHGGRYSRARPLRVGESARLGNHRRSDAVGAWAGHRHGSSSRATRTAPSEGPSWARRTHRMRTSCARGPCRNGQNTVEAPDDHRTTITYDLIEPYGAPNGTTIDTAWRVTHKGQCPAGARCHGGPSWRGPGRRWRRWWRRGRRRSRSSTSRSRGSRRRAPTSGRRSSAAG